MPLPFMKRLLPACVLLGLAGVAGAQPARAPAQPQAPVPAPAPDPQMVARQFAEYSEIQALGSRCNWFGELERQGLKSTLAERKAWLAAHGGNPDQAEAEARTRVAAIAVFPCTGDQAELRKFEIKRAIWQTTVTWSLRAEALLADATRPAWFKGQSKVEAQRAALQRRAGELQAQFASALEITRPRILADAERMLRLSCKPKQAAAGAACPTVTAEEAQLRDYAAAWVAEAETFAAVMAKAPPVPTPSLDPPGTAKK